MPTTHAPSTPATTPHVDRLTLAGLIGVLSLLHRALDLLLAVGRVRAGGALAGRSTVREADSDLDAAVTEATRALRDVAEQVQSTATDLQASRRAPALAS